MILDFIPELADTWKMHLIFGCAAPGTKQAFRSRTLTDAWIDDKNPSLPEGRWK
jgi:hypothetical protein